MLQITVYGMPGPQGSKKLVGRDGKGRGILVESSAKVKPWRIAVKYAALEAGRGQQIAGPVSIQIFFTLPKPKSAPKRRPTWPDRKPDIDKLCRSTLDALVDSGIIEDDGRVVALYTEKCFPGQGKQSLGSPGAHITIQGLL